MRSEWWPKDLIQGRCFSVRRSSFGRTGVVIIVRREKGSACHRQCLENDSCAVIEVQSTGMRSGAKCVYVTPAQDGHFAQTVKLFPGQNLVTARSSSGSTEKYVPLSVERPTLRVELNYPGPSENDCYWLEFSYNGEVYGIPPGTDIWAWGDYSAHQGFVFEHAAAGRYSVSVFHSVERTIPPPATTTVRVYLNDDLVYTASNGNGIDTWSVGTFILHSGESVGGYGSTIKTF